MIRKLHRKALLCLSTVLCTGLAAPAWSQATGGGTGGGGPSGPGGPGGAELPAGIDNDLRSRFQRVDSNGVDLVDGSFNVSIEEGSIGSGEARLSMERYYNAIGFSDNWPGQLVRRPYSNGVLSTGRDCQDFRV